MLSLVDRGLKYTFDIVFVEAQLFEIPRWFGLGHVASSGRFAS